MAAFKDIRAGLATNLLTIGGAAQVSAYMLADPTPPTLQVMGPDSIEYDATFARGSDSLFIIVQGFVGLVDDRGAQDLLDRWLDSDGDTSVKQAIETDKTLGGVVDALRVTRSSGYRIYQLTNSGPVLGAEWTVEIVT